jgi:hypothetical protein
MSPITLRYTVEKLCHHKTDEYKKELHGLLDRHRDYLAKLNLELDDINVVIQYMVQLDMQFKRRNNDNSNTDR